MGLSGGFDVDLFSIPIPAQVTPPATSLDSRLGTAMEYARADHTHAARVQRCTMTTDTSGLATWTFARPIVCAKGQVPPCTYMVEDIGTPCVVQITARSMTSDGTLDTHTAVTVKASRSRTLPSVLAAINALTSYDVFGTAAAVVKINLFAADPTQ